MVSREDIQSYIDRLDGGQAAEEVAPGLWVLRAGEGAECVVHYNPPVVVLRVRVMEPPAGGDLRVDLYRRLLELNARELVHGSYGLEGDHVVLTDALELENLDFNEFRASYDSIMLALATHVGSLAQYRER
jgi:hypothetical protein